MSATLISVLEFEDDTCSVMRLHTGDVADCRRCAEMIPAVSYSGGKSIRKSFLRIVDTDALDALMISSAATGKGAGS